MNAPRVDYGVPVDPRLTTVFTSNADAFEAILSVYAPVEPDQPRQTIIDPTFGRGVFWSKVDRSLYDVRCTDLTDGVDCRALPYPDSSADMVVLDPPYRYTPAKNKAHPALDAPYALQASAPTRTQGVIEVYVAGMAEAKRVLRHGGFLVVKCQDTVQDGKQIWVHVLLMHAAEELGFACRDLAVVAPKSVTRSRWEKQRHLRRAHSNFLVFRLGGQFPFGIPSVQAR